MGFHDLHSGSDHHHYSHSEDVDFEVSETAERVMIALSLVTLLFAAIVIGYLTKKERDEQRAAKNR